jgi:hypothetical protein
MTLAAGVLALLLAPEGARASRSLLQDGAANATAAPSEAPAAASPRLADVGGQAQAGAANASAVPYVPSPGGGDGGGDGAPHALLAGAAAVAALDALAPDRLSAIAARAGVSPDGVRAALARDPSLKLQASTGALMYSCGFGLKVRGRGKKRNFVVPKVKAPKGRKGDAGSDGGGGGGAAPLKSAADLAAKYGGAAARIVSPGTADPNATQAFTLHRRGRGPRRAARRGAREGAPGRGGEGGRPGAPRGAPPQVVRFLLVGGGRAAPLSNNALRVRAAALALPRSCTWILTVRRPCFNVPHARSRTPKAHTRTHTINHTLTLTRTRACISTHMRVHAHTCARAHARARAQAPPLTTRTQPIPQAT